MHALVDALSQYNLFFQRQVDRIQTGGTAAALVFRGTCCALNKEQMTALVLTIGMRIGRLSALVATGDDLPADPFPQPVVEYEVLASELILQSLFLHRIGIMNDSAFEMEDIVETLMQ